jgi:hypothetical protein
MRRGVGRPIAALLVDAGPLYAYVDSDDAHHAAALELYVGREVRMPAVGVVARVDGDVGSVQVAGAAGAGGPVPEPGFEVGEHDVPVGGAGGGGVTVEADAVVIGERGE